MRTSSDIKVENAGYLATFTYSVLNAFDDICTY